MRRGAMFGGCERGNGLVYKCEGFGSYDLVGVFTVGRLGANGSSYTE